MELPISITNDLMFWAVALLSFAPLLALYGTYKIGQVFFSDTERPRNRIIRRMFASGIFTTLTGMFTSILSGVYLSEVINGEVKDSDFSGLLFVLVLIGLFVQPFLNWRTLGYIGFSRIVGEPETQNQREDRQFGTERRLLEVEHNKDTETQNQRTDREAGDILRASEDEKLDNV